MVGMASSAHSNVIAWKESTMSTTSSKTGRCVAAGDRAAWVDGCDLRVRDGDLDRCLINGGLAGLSCVVARTTLTVNITRYQV